MLHGHFGWHPSGIQPCGCPGCWETWMVDVGEGNSFIVDDVQRHLQRVSGIFAGGFLVIVGGRC